MRMEVVSQILTEIQNGRYRIVDKNMYSFCLRSYTHKRTKYVFALLTMQTDVVELVTTGLLVFLYATFMPCNIF